MLWLPRYVPTPHVHCHHLPKCACAGPNYGAAVFPVRFNPHPSVFEALLSLLLWLDTSADVNLTTSLCPR